MESPIADAENTIMKAKNKMTFFADNDEKLSYKYEPEYWTITAYDDSGSTTASLPESGFSGELEWDTSIWDYWNQEKELLIDTE